MYYFFLFLGALVASWDSLQRQQHVSGTQPGCESAAGLKPDAGIIRQAGPRRVFPLPAPLFILDSCPTLTVKKDPCKRTFHLGPPSSLPTVQLLESCTRGKDHGKVGIGIGGEGSIPIERWDVKGCMH